jgi:quercetin dioxygenase-like cupin family protein
MMRWRSRFGSEEGIRMKITKLSEIEKEIPKMEGASKVSKQVPVSKRDGAPLFSFRVFTLEPGGHTPYHRHPNEHVNYVIEGNGAIVTESGEERRIEKGDFILILPDEKHQYRNKSTQTPLVFICAVPKEYE